MQFLKSLKQSLALSAVIYLVLGLLFLIIPEESSEIICKIVSIAAIVAGLVSVIRYFVDYGHGVYTGSGFAIGIMLFAVGLFFLFNTDLLTELVGVVIGLSVLFGGLTKFQQGLNLKKIDNDPSNPVKTNSWRVSMILSVVGIVLGIVVLAFSRRGIGLLFGISLIVCATIDFVLFVQALSVTKVVSNEMKPVEGNSKPKETEDK